MRQDHGRIFCGEINELKIHRLYRRNIRMLVLWGGTYIFSPEVKPCPSLRLSFIENLWSFDSQWYLVRIKERYSLFKEEFETEKQLFGISWNFADEKFDSSKILHLLKHSNSFFSLSLQFLKEWWDFIRSFRKGSLFLFWWCRRSICYVSMSAPRLSLTGGIRFVYRIKWPCT